MSSEKLTRAALVRTAVLAALALPAAPCLAVELAAVPGQWTLPDGTGSIAMWGYVEVADAASFDCTSPPGWTVGPTLRTTAAAGLTVNLKNCLTEPVSFFVPGLRATATGGTAGRFTAEVAPGGTASYALTVRPGTFLYHSATDRIRTQVPMGLYGALVVDSALGTGTTSAEAYPGVAYEQDEVLVFSAIDPRLNADPAGFGGARVVSLDRPADPRRKGWDPQHPEYSGWRPQYFLINGETHPATARPALTTGQNVLLRLVNAGLGTVVPTLDGGLYVDVLAEDGNLHPHTTRQYGVELPAGKTVDAMLLPVTEAGTYPLYDRSGHLTNGAVTGGGMLTYLDVSAGAGLFELSAASYSVAENVGTGTVTVTVNRVGGSVGAVSVDYATADGSATAGTDYTAGTGTVSFPDSDATPDTATFDVAITNDIAYEGDETFTVSLSNATGGAKLGTPSSATVTITNDDAGPGAIELSAASYSVAENVGTGTVTVTVNRVGGSAGAVSVNYATENGTATAGTDYTAATGTVSFADGDAVSKTFDVTVTNDIAYEGDETFTVSLSAPTNGATLDTPSSAVVTITEDDPSPNVAPVANDDVATTARSTQVTINVIANDEDTDNDANPGGQIDPASVVVTTGTSSQRGGTVTSNGNGTVTFTPKRNFRGTDTFQYSVADTAGAVSNVATVRVNVQ